MDEKLRRPRACENCRALKVKCLPSDSADPGGPCARCARFNKECVVNNARRKRRPKTRSKIAELEEKLEMLSRGLQVSEAAQTAPPSQPLLQQPVQPPPPAQQPAQHQMPPQPLPQQHSMSHVMSMGQNHLQSPQIHGQTPPNGGMPPQMPINGIAGMLNPSPTNPSERTPESSGTPTSASSFSVRNKDLQPRLPMAADRLFREVQNSNNPPRNLQTGIDGGDEKQKTLATWNALVQLSAKRTELIHSTTYAYCGQLGPHNDIIARGILTQEEAEMRLQQYRSVLQCLYGIVVIPDDCSVEELRTTKPFLFLAIMNSSSNAILGPKFQGTSIEINVECYKSITSEIMVVGTKSFELVQCLALMMIWYNNCELAFNQKYHLLISMAVSIANDIGINDGPFTRVSSLDTYESIMRPNVVMDPKSRECRKLWLVIYFQQVNMSSLLKKPMIIKWNSYLQECCDLFSTPDSTINEIRCAKLAKVFKELEDMMAMLRSEDYKKPLDVNDERTQRLVKHFDGRIDEVFTFDQRGFPIDHVLELFKSSLKISLHELCMLTNVSSTVPRTPFSEFGLNIFDLQLTPAVINSAISTAQAVRTSLEGFSELYTMQILSSSTLYLARMTYCATTALMLRSCALLHPKFGDLVETEYPLQLIQKIISNMNDVVDQAACCSHVLHFKFILHLLLFYFDRQMKTWYDLMEAKNAISPRDAEMPELLPGPVDNIGNYGIPESVYRTFPQLVSVDMDGVIPFEYSSWLLSEQYESLQ
ncbi:Transcriptional regulator WAR1 [Yarrowia sp. B02]|nr:Transcriptional regulator WAR1 [Yarrowia sp. B02]